MVAVWMFCLLWTMFVISVCVWHVCDVCHVVSRVIQYVFCCCGVRYVRYRYIVWLLCGCVWFWYVCHVCHVCCHCVCYVWYSLHTFYYMVYILIP